MRDNKMLKYFVVLLSLTSYVASSVSIVDNGRRFSSEKITEANDNNFIDVSHADECPNLTPKLVEEIKSHQTVVNDIVRAIVNGTYSGDTWNA